MQELDLYQESDDADYDKWVSVVCDSASLSEQLMCRHQIMSKLMAESNFIFNCNNLYVENFKSSSIAVLVARLQFGGNGDSCENVQWLANWTLHACIT